MLTFFELSTRARCYAGAMSLVRAHIFRGHAVGLGVGRDGKMSRNAY